MVWVSARTQRGFTEYVHHFFENVVRYLRNVSSATYAYDLLDKTVEAWRHSADEIN